LKQQVIRLSPNGVEKHSTRLTSLLGKWQAASSHKLVLRHVWFGLVWFGLVWLGLA